MNRLFTLVLIGVLAACGRIAFEPIGADRDGAVGVDATQAADASEAIPPVANPLFYADAADVDAAGTPGASGCPGTGPTAWRDLAIDATGSLDGFAEPPCGINGWAGDGSVSEPYRLNFSQSERPLLSFGTVAHSDRYTVQAWIRYTGLGDPAGTGTGGISLVPIVAKGSAEAEEPMIDVNYSMGVTEEGVLGFDFEDAKSSDNHPFESATQVATNEWHHVAVTYDQDQLHLYVDGASVASRAQSEPPSVATDSILGIGSVFESTGMPETAAFDGDIAIVRIFGRALAPMEVATECLTFAGRFGISCGT